RGPICFGGWAGTARPRPPTNVRPPSPRRTPSGTSSDSVAVLPTDRVMIPQKRDAFCAGIRETNARGAAAGSWWTVQFLIRRFAWHMLDHAGEMEDRDLS